MIGVRWAASHARPAALLLGAALFTAATAHGIELEGVRLDDRITLAGRPLVINGAGVREKLLLKIYVVALYLPKSAGNVAGVFCRAPRRIQMNMLVSASADEIVDALLDTMADNSSSAELAAIKPQTDRLVALIRRFKAVRKGDVVTLDFVGGGTNLGWNGTFRGRIPGASFNRALSRIWLGDKPVQADLKERLLGR
ncbi:MAG TPA: chalcone isomerase family protein [Casimicrobiaceae bacterium]|nr:chalcone isomerase family protein [Casimicrobiaceae bacterium]